MHIFKKHSFGLIVLLFAVLTALAWQPLKSVSAAASEVQANKVVMYFFWGDGCPHCTTAKPYLEELKGRYPNLEVRALEVWYNDANQELLNQTAANYGFKASAVPTFFIGEKSWTGYNDQIAQELETAIQVCSTSACPDPSTVKLPSAIPYTPKKTYNNITTYVIIGGCVIIAILVLVAVVGSRNKKSKKGSTPGKTRRTIRH
jgi:thiol-disulfide isomerase/thioredoxin